MRNYVKPVLTFLCISLGVGSCICGDLERDSGLDPANDTRIDGTPVVGDSSLTITLVDEYASKFIYKLDAGAWYETTDNVVVVDYDDLLLDEGDHNLYVVMVNADGTEDATPETLAFTVDLVNTAALLVKPRTQEASAGSRAHVQVMLEELEDDSLIHAEFTVGVDPALLSIDSVAYSGFIGTGVSDLSGSDPTAGTYTVHFTDNAGTGDGLATGSGPVVDIFLSVLGSGTADVSITGALMQTTEYPGTDPSLDRVPYVRGGRIVID